MTEFNFSQVDAVLSALNGIAIDKRIAFMGRLKFLLKNGLPTGERPGKGKAASYSFCDLMQLAIAVELMQAGMDQKRAASLVKHNWSALRSTVYLSTFTQAERVEAASEGYGADEFTEGTDWLWMIDLEALAELTAHGVSEYDDYEAIRPVPAADASKHLSVAGSVLSKRKRTLFIYGGSLTQYAVHLIAFQLKFASVAELRDDLLAEEDELRRSIEGLDDKLREFRANLTDEKRAEIAQAFRDADRADYSTNPPTSSAALEARAREMMPRLSPTARAMIDEYSSTFVRNGVVHFLIDTDAKREGMHELIDFGVFEAFETTDDLSAFSFELSPFGQAALRIAAEVPGGSDVDQEA
ncbi:hypothetical protein [Sphingomonas asaccharolytica]|uniref:hypothetical protein n=1 Tax=Sphingomonas asaccharolytica TaxID=40681 RepID=UPI000833C3FD|nr:hypothetical protein [Sphingomonas asaccharolytica]